MSVSIWNKPLPHNFVSMKAGQDQTKRIQLADVQCALRQE
jgi:hypothetical protein